jgi:membrane associated rhomboid family serine protease
MFLPIGDEPNDHVRPPYVVWGLIGVNVLVMLALMGRSEVELRALYDTWGFDPQDFRPITMLTHMFLHVGWMHLIGNMLFLWIFGDNMESRLGHVGFLAAYLGTGVAAMGAHAAISTTTEVAVGASGAVSGVMGLYFVACPGAKVRMLIWLYVFVQVVMVPARALMVVWIVLQDILPAFIGRRDGVAHWAHLGGFVAGLALMLLLLPVVPRSELPPRPNVNERYRHRHWSEEEES